MIVLGIWLFIFNLIFIILLTYYIFRTNFKPNDFYYNSHIYPAMILNNYTYLAHNSQIQFLDINKISQYKKNSKTLILFKQQLDFINYIDSLCWFILIYKNILSEKK